MQTYGKTSIRNEDYTIWIIKDLEEFIAKFAINVYLFLEKEKIGNRTISLLVNNAGVSSEFGL